MQIIVDKNKCQGCAQCIYLCPVGALSIVNGKCQAEDGCVSCGNCMAICPFGAISA